MTYASARLGSADRPKGRSALKAKVSTLAAAALRTITLRSNRRAVYRLMSLEEQHLKDIGVSRADIEWALSKPWGVDPSEVLAARVERRRAAARWARKLRTQT